MISRYFLVRCFSTKKSLDAFQLPRHIDHGPKHHLRVYDHIFELLSDVDNPTPLVKLNKLVPFKHAKVYAKLEWYNPFGSVKDRVGFNMICDA